jgi:3-oxoacyl-[acyl-carrier protein] reductase
VVINDRDKEPTDEVVKEITAAGGTAAPCYEPVGDQAAAVAIVRAAVDAFGQIDVMVTNAGADRRGFILDLTPEDWEFTIRTHLFGSLHCSVEAAKAMRDRGQGGAIINVTSDAFYSAPVQLAPYCVSKGGIYGLMLSLSVELAPLGISVNAIAPPATGTGPMLAYVDTLASLGMTGEQLDGFKSMIQQPEDVAPLAVFLATPEGRKLSGHVLTLTHDELTVLRPPSHPDAPVRTASGPFTLDELLTAVPNLV